MRLSKIKLAGFKSFVDPTSVTFPSNLSGVVGPNGCGKSNVIDAVRWVMGEISAKHLRGDSMADVVFNGSSSRKPVGTASVELVFDNSDGQLGGQYAAFAEVSLKRIVSRDGTSAYFLNGTRCRRKDITQLFLGTGLGSRSYAIIEQGMISRVIDAKPDELRAFVEEAAGISRYKERRRETENRIAHTKENLERLGDVRGEVEKQLRHLQRQAATARRYQALKQDERRLSAELLALRLRELDTDSQSKAGILRERDNRLQEAIAAQRSLESQLETARSEHADQSTVLNGVQGRYYEVGAQISRTEQNIQHSREMRRRQQDDLQQIESGLGESQAHLERDQARIDEIASALDGLSPQLESARGRERESTGRFDVAEIAMQSWQERWEEFNVQFRSASESTHAERARIEQLESQLQRVVGQRDKTAAEIASLATDDLEARIEVLAAEVETAREANTLAASGLQQVAAQLEERRNREQSLVARLEQSRQLLQEVQGRAVSLEALQQAALGRAQGGVAEWLESHVLHERPRLGEKLTVEAGWERAAETVLGSYLEAVCVDDLDAAANWLDSFNHGSVSFFDSTSNLEPAPAGTTLLASKVSGPSGIEELFSGVVAVATLSEAVAGRAALEPGQSMITRDGVWIGRSWLRVSRDQDVHMGVIQREHELRKLKGKVAEALTQRDSFERELADARASLRDLERQRDQAQEDANRCHRSLSDRMAQLDTVGSRIEHSKDRLAKLHADAADAAGEVARLDSEIAEARARLETGLERMVSVEDMRRDLERRRDELREDLGVARAQANRDRAEAQEIAIQVESKRSSRESIVAGLDRTREQIERLTQRREELQRQIHAGIAPLEELERALATSLEARIAVEAELAEARRSLEAIEHRIRGLDQDRIAAEARVDEARHNLEDVRLAAQELKVRRESILEQFAATHFELDSVFEQLPAEAAVDSWEESLGEVTGKIERLGQVNLAAIDEFKQQSERKEYLDRQFKDLTDALETLETAIRKIERETRSRFQDTFDRINAGLKDRFPRLFGGGNAYLELTGDDVLNAGVAIMARPPGKRNSTISQLSGGEKALTAVALVFSIFELNPAPFCLLDEVDAPLDDNNVGRFCETVQEMAERVQFIFITHNKATMELASQLIGVTMHEPGVSRLVAVDIDEAVRMAAM
jgi:chromosome segregation protein